MKAALRDLDSLNVAFTAFGQILEIRSVSGNRFPHTAYRRGVIARSDGGGVPTILDIRLTVARPEHPRTRGGRVAGGRARVVEVDAAGLTWVKSSASASGNDTCIEVAVDGGRVHVRSSRYPSGPRVVVNRAVWVAFVDEVRARS